MHDHCVRFADYRLHPERILATLAYDILPDQGFLQHRCVVTTLVRHMRQVCLVSERLFRHTRISEALIYDVLPVRVLLQYRRVIQ